MFVYMLFNKLLVALRMYRQTDISIFDWSMGEAASREDIQILKQKKKLLYIKLFLLNWYCTKKITIIWFYLFFINLIFPLL